MEAVFIIATIGAALAGIVGTIGWVHIRELKIKREIAEIEAGPAREIDKAEFNQLRQRVEVLERLLTDDDRRLASEIGRLQREGARV